MKAKPNTFSSTCLRVKVLLLASLFLSACQVPPLEVYDYTAPYFDSAYYPTISVKALTEKQGKLIQAVNKHMALELENKGYQVTDSNPSLTLLYDINLAEDTRLKKEILHMHGYSYETTRLEAVFEAKILLNVVDNESSNVVWKSASTRDLTNVNLQSVDEGRLADRVEELLESFPDH